MADHIKDLTMTSSRYRLSTSDLTLPVLLLTLSLIPTLGGVMRLISVAGDTAVTPDNARFLAAPGAVVIHASCASVYALVGAFQFSRGFRLRFAAWHRRAGK